MLCFNQSILIFLCFLIQSYKAINSIKNLLGRHEQNFFEVRRKSSLNPLGLALETCKVHVLFRNECYILKQCIAVAIRLSAGQKQFSNQRDKTA